MKHNLDSTHNVGQQFRVSYISANELHIADKSSQVLFFSRAKIVEHPNRVSVPGEAFRNMAADESSSAGYKVRSF